MSANLDDPAVATGLEKGQSSSQFTRRVVPKNVHIIGQLHSSSMLVRSKILHARLQHYANQELPDVQAGFRKERGIRDKIASIYWIIEKAREFQKNIYISSTMLKPLMVWIMTNCGKFLDEITRPSYLSPEKPV